MTQIVFFLLTTLLLRSVYAFDAAPMFSYVLPGSVETYEGHYFQGLTTFAISLGMYDNAQSKSRTADKLLVSDSNTGSTTLVRNKGSLELDASFTAVSGLRMMSAYNAYRVRGGHSESYSDILLAPFNPQELLRPLSVASLLLAGAMLLRAGDDYNYQWQGNVARADMNRYVFGRLAYVPAVAEEMFFRGYLNTELSKNFSPWIGVPVSALVFAAVHKGVGIQADARIAGAAGLGLATLQVSNDYNISQGVALHFWVNFFAGLKAIESGGRADNLLSFAFLF